MKILWITNILPPEAESEITHNDRLRGSGGWMVSLCEALTNHIDYEIVVASVHQKVKTFREIQGVYNKYYVLPYGKGNISYNSEYEQYWRLINEKEHPNVVHIHGTEFSHGLAWLKTVGTNNVVISIQGLVHVISKYAFYGVSRKDYLRNWQPLNLLINEKKNLNKRAVCEIDYLKVGKYFIGRTEWDETHVLAINPNARYYHCGEMLRSGFYTTKWDLKNVERHSIFVSQANSSIKGFHQILKALPLIHREFPDAKVYVGNSSYFLSPNNLRKRLLKSTWFSYIESLIKELSLQDYVHFLPSLDEQEMINCFLKTHVFVLPSSIENSSNSLAEAQMIGVPSVASYVGGTPSMIKDGVTGLMYRFEEYEMLASKICDVLKNDELAIKLSERAREVSHKRHDKTVIINGIESIYESIKTFND